MTIKRDHNFPEIVPAEYRTGEIKTSAGQVDPPYMHPYTGTTRRFVVQDRFHASTKPHKSPLCLFHNIDLCQQANCVAMSTENPKMPEKINGG